MLTITDLTFAYDESVQIFRDYSLSLEEEERICLVGRNGVGKTTLLSIISGLIYAPDMSITLFGETATQKELKDQVIYVPTEPSFYGDLTAGEFVKFIQFLWDQPAYFPELAQENMNRLYLEYGPQQSIEAFSLGMKYKLYLAIFLAIPRKILLLDEPLNALDTKSREVAVELIKQYVSQNKAACLFSSHVKETIASLSTAVIELK